MLRCLERLSNQFKNEQKFVLFLSTLLAKSTPPTLLADKYSPSSVKHGLKT